MKKFTEEILLPFLFFIGILACGWLVIYIFFAFVYAINEMAYTTGAISQTPKPIFLLCFLVLLSFKKGVSKGFDKLVEDLTFFL